MKRNLSQMWGRGSGRGEAQGGTAGSTRDEELRKVFFYVLMEEKTKSEFLREPQEAM